MADSYVCNIVIIEVSTVLLPLMKCILKSIYRDTKQPSFNSVV